MVTTAADGLVKFTKRNAGMTSGAIANPCITHGVHVRTGQD